ATTCRCSTNRICRPSRSGSRATGSGRRASARIAVRYFAEYDGDPPEVRFYRPDWAPGEATWFQVYETVSEGTSYQPFKPNGISERSN
ncbi:MAG: hypothetical protein WCH79_16185, partial [Planctomycetia bacterium]